MALRPPVFRPPHQRDKRQKRRDDDARRGSAQERGYDSVWAKLAKAHRAAEPLCRRCWADGVVTLGQLVDHIVTVEEAPHLRQRHVAARSGFQHPQQDQREQWRHAQAARE